MFSVRKQTKTKKPKKKKNSKKNKTMKQIETKKDQRVTSVYVEGTVQTVYRPQFGNRVYGVQFTVKSGPNNGPKMA